MFDPLGGTPQQVRLTLYTDSFVIKGLLTTRQRRVTDMLNLADHFDLACAVKFDAASHNRIQHVGQHLQRDVPTLGVVATS